MLGRALSHGTSAQVSTMVDDGQRKFPLPLPCCIFFGLSPFLLFPFKKKNNFCVNFHHQIVKCCQAV